MKKVLRYFLLILLAAGVLFTFYFLWKKARPQKQVYELHTPVLGDIEQKTVVTGKIEPRDLVAIVPQISGIVSDLYKQPGQMAKAGDVIARIKVIPQMEVLNAAESRVTQARLNLHQEEKVFARTKELYQSELWCKKNMKTQKRGYNWHRKSCAMHRTIWRLCGMGL